jgi:thiol-disulfide isomerase/thioredoxin
MLRRAPFPGLLAICLFARAAIASDEATWRTTVGQVIEGDLVNVYGGYAFIQTDDSSNLVSLDGLDDGSLDHVAVFLAAGPRARATWATTKSAVPRALRSSLSVLRDGRIVDFDGGASPEPEFYVVYFSAHWCPPCRLFTPRLVDLYAKLKKVPSIADRFEVIFVSDDRTEFDQWNYVKLAGMPWPFLKYSALGNSRVIERWAGEGIPDLVVLDREGRLIFNTYKGSQYLGPEDPLQRFCNLVGQLNPRSPKTARARHRLAVRQYILAGAHRSLQPKAYFVGLNPDHFQGIAVKRFDALVTLDEEGRVTSVDSKPKLPLAYQMQFQTEAGAWLFLPAVKDGSAVGSQVDMPVVF